MTKKKPIPDLVHPLRTAQFAMSEINEFLFLPLIIANAIFIMVWDLLTKPISRWINYR